MAAPGEVEGHQEHLEDMEKEDPVLEKEVPEKKGPRRQEEQVWRLISS